MDFDVSMTSYFDRHGFEILIFFAIALTVLFLQFCVFTQSINDEKNGLLVKKYQRFTSYEK